MLADKNAVYHLADVDLSDREFVQSLTNEQFTELLQQSLHDPNAAPADLSGAPALHQPGDAVAFFPPPRAASDDDPESGES